MMHVVQRVCFSLVAMFLPLVTTAGAQVVGTSAVLQSTTSNELDGYSETDIQDADTAYYYYAGVDGYAFEGGNQVDERTDAPEYVTAASYPSASIHQGYTYTVYSDHYLIAVYEFIDGSYYNPEDYDPVSGFAPGGIGDPSGTGYEPGGGPEYVEEQVLYLGYTYVQLSTAPPSISHISPPSDVQGSSGTIQVQGQNLRDSLGAMPTAHFQDGDISVSVSYADAVSASLSYSISGSASIGAHQLVMTNTWGDSEPVNFSVIDPSGNGDSSSQVLPVDPCAITSDPKSKFTSIVATSATPGSGALSIAFSGSNFSAVHLTVAYGPYSTPESVAASIAALVTKNYALSGLIAKAVGSGVIFTGVAEVGVVNVTGGSNFGTDTSSASASSVGAACRVLAPVRCLFGLFPNYDVPIAYRNGPTETARQHIIRRHINNTPSLGTDIYSNPGRLTPDQVFGQVRRFNQRTVLFSPNIGGVYTLYFPPNPNRDDSIGEDYTGSYLNTNKFVVKAEDACVAVTSYPTKP